MEAKVSKIPVARHTSTLCIAVIFIFLLVTMRCWIGFGGRKQLISLAFPVLMFMFYAIGQVRFSFKKRYVIFSLIVAIVSLLLLKHRPNIIGLIYQIVPAFSILMVLCIPDNDKEYVFEKIVKWFAILMMVSIPFYLMNLLVHLPSLGTITADYGNEEYIAGTYANYLFYIKPLEVVGEASYLRFNGPFIEPGDLGCVSAFMLMATRFDFKRYKYLWVVISALVFSFSLAGYLLALFAYVTIFFYVKGKGRTTLIVAAFLIIGVYIFGSFYNDGNNFLNEAILSRLQADEDVGFSGNNRTSLVKVEYFLMMFNNPHTFLFGYDNDTIEVLFEKSLGAGFINQFIIVGLVGILGMLLPYLYFTLTSSSRRYAVIFFIFLLLYFFQRTDTLWIAIVMSYAYGIVIKERETCVR